MGKQKLIFIILILFLTATIPAQEPPPKFESLALRGKLSKGKNPVIVIPGLLGSELINKHSKEKVWFSLRRSKDDDLRLPINASFSRNRDNLVPGDIVREIKFLLASRDFYGSILKSLEENGGYEPASLDSPPKSLKDKYFVFPYDWRRDNVETARRLYNTMRALKRKSGEKNVKFEILAHSMGGLIARYAAMYGNQDIPRTLRPNWNGRFHISQVHLFGTPHGGAADSLQALLEGYGAVKGINIPFVQDLEPLEIFTMPAMFQLLPFGDSVQFFDENLKPLDVDIYDFREWEKYRWSMYGIEKLEKRFDEQEIVRMHVHLEKALARAKRFHLALASSKTNRIPFYSYVSNCSETLSGYVLYQKDGKWITLTEPKSFKKEDGERVLEFELKAAMLKRGDGRVTNESALSIKNGKDNVFSDCESHDTLTSNKVLQRHFFNLVLPRRD